jgi:hypothetical protein
MSILNYFWPKTAKNQNSTKKATYIDMIISLNENYEIDFSIFIDDKVDKLNINEKDYSIICSSFINAVISNKMKRDVIEILDEQIKNSHNKKLINNIVSLISFGVEKPVGQTFIRPSEVFFKNSI